MSVRRGGFRSWLLSRAGGVDANPTTVVQKAGAFAATAAGVGGVSLVSVRTADGLRGFFSGPDGHGSAQSALKLAHTVGARAEPAEVPGEVADASHVGWLVFDTGSAVAREAQAGSDLAELPRQLSTTLSPGEWVGVSLRAPRKKEVRRHGKWLAHRLAAGSPTHHSMSQTLLVASVFGGGGSAADVRSTLGVAAAAMPGFDVRTKVRVVSRLSGTVLVPGVVAAMFVALAAVFGSGVLAGVPFVGDWLSGGTKAAFFVALALTSVLAGGLRFVGVLPSVWSRVSAGLDRGVLPAPGLARGRVRGPKQGVRQEDGSFSESDEGDYPLAPSAFLVGPQVVVGVVAPLAGAASGAESTADRAVPEVLRDRVGPLLGDADGLVHLSGEVGKEGVFVVGKPGSGKTALLRAFWSWTSLERTCPSGRRGFPGARQAMVTFESKDAAGVAEYREWTRVTGDSVSVIEVAGGPSTGPAIDMLDGPGSVEDRADLFVNAMVYAFGEGAIQDRSFKTLKAVFVAALAAPADVVSRVPGCDGLSRLEVAHVLLAGRGDRLGVDLAAEIRTAATRLNAPGVEPSSQAADLKVAAEALAPLYEGRSESARRPLVEAAENKVAQLAAARSWWSPDRERVSWRDVLTGHRSVVVNLGKASDGGSFGDRLRQQLGSMLMFLLREEVSAACADWSSQDRGVSLFADELKLVAGSSPEVFEWFRDQGRSFGVRLYLATQRPEQLDARTRTAMLTFGTVISYTHEDVDTARQVAAQVSAHEGDWEASDVQHLEPWHAIVRTVVDRRRQPAFVAHVHDFAADRDAFPALNGYTVDGTRTEVVDDLADADGAVFDPYASVTDGDEPVWAEEQVDLWSEDRPVGDDGDPGWRW